MEEKKFDCYMAPILIRNLEHLKQRIQKQDNDCVIVIDGTEGSGKSVFAMQIAKYVDDSFCLDRVCMNPNEFKQAIKQAKPKQAIIFDEAFTGLSSRASLSIINKLLISRMMEMRQKNLFVIVVIPSIFFLDRYVVLFRSIGLFHVYERKGIRGYWTGFNRTNKKMLYLLGQKTMSYLQPKVLLKGRFYGKYVLDEAAYREKKRKSLEESEKNIEIESRYKQERDKVIRICYQKLQNLPEYIDLLRKGGLELSYRQISRIISGK